MPNGSNLDLVTELKDPSVTREAINEAALEASRGPLAEVWGYTDEPIVSSDVVGDTHSAVFDAQATMALPGGLVKTISWFDNGWGFASRVAETVTTLGGFDEAGGAS